MQNTSGSTLGEIVAVNPAAARVLDRLGLDYCCHGQHTLAEACAAAGLDPAAVARELEALPLDGDTSWTGLGPAALVDHIVATHHRYLEDELPLLDALAAKVFSVHGERHPELAEVWSLLDALRIELKSHLRDEEELLFPAVHGWSAGQRVALGSLAGLLRLMLADHDRAGDLLAALRRATNAFAVPDDACASYEGPREATGPKVLFKAENAGTEDHELEVLDDQEEAVGEVEAFPPGGDAEPLAVELEPGTYTLQCILETKDGKVHRDLGMVTELAVK